MPHIDNQLIVKESEEELERLEKGRERRARVPDKPLKVLWPLTKRALA